VKVDAADERPHRGCVDEWAFALINADGTTGVVTGHRLDPRHRRVGYWWCLVRSGEPLLHVVDWEIPARTEPGLAKGEQLWAEMLCEDPLEQWTIGNETTAVALDDPDDALGVAHGSPTPVACDIEWYAAGSTPTRIDDGFVQHGVAHGVIEVAGRPPMIVEEWRCVRWRRWWLPGAAGWGSTPPPLPVVAAHTGRRAPVVGEDGSSVDFVLVPDGWAIRRPITAAGELR